MREILSLSVGQAGNQVGAKFWEGVCREHGIDSRSGEFQGDSELQMERVNVYFNEAQDRFVPRSIMVDLEPGVLDSIRGSREVGRLFHPDSLISGVNGAGNNYASGFYTEGCELVDQVQDAIRHEVEGCDLLQAFQITHSVGGGTGSGLGSLLMSRLREEYAHKLSFNFSVFPSPSASNVVVEPYNTVLTSFHLIEDSAANFILENEAMTDILQKKLKVESPSFADLNFTIA